jgi:type I restriction-modification system DNA methylase subunit
VLRDDGMSYGDYVEQLTYLLFLKMADERSQPPWSQPSPITKGFDWPSLLAKDGDELFDHCRHLLDELGKEKGTIGLIFAKAQNKFQDPAKLRRLVVDLIDGENWSAMGTDVKGDACEGLLEKNAQDTKSGAGQYFTPRPLIQAMVDCIAPKPGETICDPACGTGGFLFAPHNHVASHNPNLTREQKKHLKEKALRGWELVQSTARLAAMNMMLHGIGSDKSQRQPAPARRDRAGDRGRPRSGAGAVPADRGGSGGRRDRRHACLTRLPHYRATAARPPAPSTHPPPPATQCPPAPWHSGCRPTPPSRSAAHTAGWCSEKEI